MADYRLIYRNAGTGERVSSLSHLGFRVWVQYQLSADDFGVCPAVASKLQGENTALEQESPKRVQAEIENLIAVGLCGVFVDGRRRYLYQPDWQDWQRLRYAAVSPLPTIPDGVSPEPSGKTRELLRQKSRKVPETFPPRASACDAPANADAAAALSEGVPGEPLSRPIRFVPPAEWDRQHRSHVAGFCDWVCFPQSVFDGFVARLRLSGRPEGELGPAVKGWALGVRADWQRRGAVPGDDIFAFWRNEWQGTHGSNKPAATGGDPLSGVKEALRG